MAQAPSLFDLVNSFNARVRGEGNIDEDLDDAEGPIENDDETIDRALGPVAKGKKRMQLAHHEQSETVQTPEGKWVNVYGKGTPNAGKRLPRDATGTGHEEYDDVDAAVEAAGARSKAEGDFKRGFDRINSKRVPNPGRSPFPTQGSPRG